MPILKRCSQVLFLIPSHLDALLPHLAQRQRGWRGTGRSAASTLRHIVCCGEALRPETVRRTLGALPAGVRLHNLYGPTEGSMTWEPCDDPQATEVLIGHSIDDTVVVLLDENLQATPIGVPGEVCFGGAIAAGYLKQPGLTAAKFVPNPLDGLMRIEPRVPAAERLYRSGDLAVRLPSGNLRFLGRIDRQVKLRGYRIELEAIEAVAQSRCQRGDGGQVWLPHPTSCTRLRHFSPCCASLHAHATPHLLWQQVQLAAAVVGSEIVIYVTMAAMTASVDETKASPGSGILEACTQSLPSYMQPSKVLALAELPRLHNGKVNLMALAEPALVSAAEVIEEAAKEATAGGAARFGRRHFATDSLGMVRELNAADSSLSLGREKAIADVLRALLMYGVIMDHYAGCADGATCRLVVEDIVWRQPLSIQHELMWLDTFVRMIGNYKCMSGFIMASAYLDSGYRRSTHWGRGDLVTFLTYIQMIWVLDPLMFAACSTTMPDHCSKEHFSFAGVHRWYLLVMLVIKALLAAMRVARLPPLGQCVLITVVALTLPPEMGCLTEERCESTAASDVGFWRGSLQCEEQEPDYCKRVEDGIRSRLAPVWMVLFQGPYADTWSMFSSVAMRYYFLFVTLYFWTFHYGRSAIAALSVGVKALGLSPGGVRLSAALCLLVIELVQSAQLGPRTYYYMQENYMGTYTPQLLPTLAVLVLLALAVILLVAAIGPDPHPPRIIRTMGSTTLGCYVVHMYLTFPLTEASSTIASLPARLGFGTGMAVQLTWLFGLPILVQLTVGVAFHKLLMVEVKWLAILLEHTISSVVSHLRRAACRRARTKAKAASAQHPTAAIAAASSTDATSAMAVSTASVASTATVFDKDDPLYFI